MKIKDAGIQPYPDEVRAARLLEGAKITEQSRQIIMTTAGNTYDPEKIASALQRHFPPYVPGRNVRKGPIGDRVQQIPPRSKGRGKGEHQGGRWRSFVAEVSSSWTTTDPFATVCRACCRQEMQRSA
jgi:hypothetical protein